MNPALTTTAATKVKTFLCPGDGQDEFYTTIIGGGTHAGTNYVVNIGSGQVGTGFGNTYDPRFPTDGLFWYGSKVKITAISDGTSNTIMWSQCLRGTNEATITGPRSSLSQEQQRRLYGSLSGRGVNSDGGINPQFSDADAATCDKWVGNRGGSWIWGNPAVNGFVTYLPPNSPTPDLTAHGQGWLSARSSFVGGANAALADGSVRFIRDSVDPLTWRGMGSRAGGEIVTLD